MGAFAEFERNLIIERTKECEYWLELSKDLEYISINTYDRLLALLSEIIGSLINYMKTIN